MAVDENTVRRIAFLARLKVHEDKLNATKDEFNKILDWMAELDEVNTDDVEPLISVNEQTLRLRDDEVSDGNQRDAVLKNAPSAEFDYFSVPKVVE
jgi:aspartyl-tRNA(Asn)/glutamyl-tRNA(Gln) amidotransferase subunit C